MALHSLEATDRYSRRMCDRVLEYTRKFSKNTTTRHFRRVVAVFVDKYVRQPVRLFRLRVLLLGS